MRLSTNKQLASGQDYLRSVSLEDILNGTYAKLDNKFDHWDGSI